jgi:hypothetical protein
MRIDRKNDGLDDDDEMRFYLLSCSYLYICIYDF